MEKPLSDCSSLHPNGRTAITIKWAVAAVFVHYRVDDHAVRHQTLFDDPDRKRRRRHALLGAGFAGPLLALDYRFRPVLLRMILLVLLLLYLLVDLMLTIEDILHDLL